MTPDQKTVRALFAELMRSTPQTFPALGEKLHAPDRRGVYVIYDTRGNVVHVGRTPKAKRGIAQRLRNHMAAASSFTNEFLKGNGTKLRGKYTFRCVIVENPRHRAFLEAYAIGHLCPATLVLASLLANPVPNSDARRVIQ